MQNKAFLILISHIIYARDVIGYDELVWSYHKNVVKSDQSFHENNNNERLLMMMMWYFIYCNSLTEEE